jgi:putative hydrolase of the HAD superfamily
VREWYWSDPERERRGRLDLPHARRDMIALALERIGRPDPALALAAAQRYTARREACYRLAAGAREALGRARRHFPGMALVTNGASAPQRAKIERFGLAVYFDHIQVEGELGLGKPEPGVYAHASSALGVRASECLFVGDNYRADVLGPLGAGMHAAWIDVEGTGRPPLPAPRPHASARSLLELVERLGL